MDLEAPSTRIRIFLKAELLFPFQAIPPAFPDIRSIDRIEKKKKNLKKEKSLDSEGGLVPQRHCCGTWKQQDMNPKSIWRKRWLM